MNSRKEDSLHLHLLLLLLNMRGVCVKESMCMVLFAYTCVI